MDDELFNTPEKINAAVSAFRNLQEHEGWKLFVKILEANIEVLTSQLENGVEDETKADVDRTRDKLRIMRDMKNTPYNMIAKLNPPEANVPEADPYATV